ncbi:hypothetical protein KAX02_07870 [candidate division WOR-3 bacterium]|nr:hypothetical protein [candidate division WOR-3 bacterium]
MEYRRTSRIDTSLDNVKRKRSRSWVNSDETRLPDGSQVTNLEDESSKLEKDILLS